MQLRLEVEDLRSSAAVDGESLALMNGLREAIAIALSSKELAQLFFTAVEARANSADSVPVPQLVECLDLLDMSRSTRELQEMAGVLGTMRRNKIDIRELKNVCAKMHDW